MNTENGHLYVQANRQFPYRGKLAGGLRQISSLVSGSACTIRYSVPRLLRSGTTCPVCATWPSVLAAR